MKIYHLKILNKTVFKISDKIQNQEFLFKNLQPDLTQVSYLN